MNVVTKSVLGIASMVWLTGAAAQAAPAADGAVEAAIRAGTVAWMTAYNAGDAQAIVALYAPDAVVMPPGAPRVSGHAAILQGVSKDIAGAQAAGVSLAMGTTNEVGVEGDMAWHVGTYQVTDKKSGATVDSGSYAEIWHKVGDKWLITRDIWNSDRPAAVPAPASRPASTTR